MNEDRLVDIETKLAFQEDTLQQLNDVVCQQQKQLDQLQVLCEHLLARVKDMQESGNRTSGTDEKPPHY